MNCRDFEAWVERGQALISDASIETSDPSIGILAGIHAEGCAECSELLELLELSEDPELETQFTHRILRATSGPVCAEVQGWISGEGYEARGEDPPLLAEHVDHCAECRGLATVLEALPPGLTSLAEIAVAPGFTEAVLRRTLPLGTRLRRQWVGSWRSWVRRPRFATELAYALTVTLLLLLGNPAAPLAAMSQGAREFVPAVETLVVQPRSMEAWLSRWSRTVGVAQAVETLEDVASEGRQQMASVWQLGIDTVERGAAVFEGLLP